MRIIEFYKGCNINPHACIGPWNDGIAIFGTESRFLERHFIISCILGILVFLGLVYFNKKSLGFSQIILYLLLSVIFTIIIFLIAAYSFPDRVLY